MSGIEGEAGLIIRAFVKCRDSLAEKVRELSAPLTQAQRDHDATMGIFSKRLQQLMKAAGVTSFRHKEHGTAFEKEVDWITVQDWAAFRDWVIENDMLQMFSKAVNKTAVKEYMKANNNALPPGLSYGKKVEVQVRRPG